MASKKNNKRPITISHNVFDGSVSLQCSGAMRTIAEALLENARGLASLAQTIQFHDRSGVEHRPFITVDEDGPEVADDVKVNKQ